MCRADWGPRQLFAIGPSGVPRENSLFIKLFVARHLNHHAVRQGIDNRCANPVQTARCLIGLAAELTRPRAGCIKSPQARICLGIWGADQSDAAAIVADGHAIICVQFNLDPVGMACDRLVHRVVKDFGHQMVQGAFIGAADIHAWAFAYRFQAFQHLDRWHFRKRHLKIYKSYLFWACP
jgi:hypothetical protein